MFGKPLYMSDLSQISTGAVFIYILASKLSRQRETYNRNLALTKFKVNPVWALHLLSMYTQCACDRLGRLNGRALEGYREDIGCGEYEHMCVYMSIWNSFGISAIFWKLGKCMGLLPRELAGCKRNRRWVSMYRRKCKFMWSQNVC